MPGNRCNGDSSIPTTILDRLLKERELRELRRNGKASHQRIGVADEFKGYCNNVLWPLFHYLGLPQEDRLATTRSFQSQFAAYKKANQMFADVVLQHYQEGDVVWCHDYHLMFLPECLKKHNSSIKVGWFLHTPFPSSEIHRTLPSRSELQRAVLAADLVGFHTYDYARHFVSACTRILELEGTPEGVEDDQGRLTRVAAFPIGIDSERFIRALEVPQVQEHVRELKKRFSGRKVMLGVDRLDMIKGIPQKLLAFEKFLEENPVWHDKVVLLQITLLTRTDVPEYQKLTSQVHEIVGRINGRFGTLTAVPIHHLGFNLTLTEPVDSPGRRGGDQIKEMDLKLHPELREHLTALCNDPHTTIVVLSGSARSVLDENFGEFNIWLAAEHGMFLRHTGGEWMTTMPEYINTKLLDSVRMWKPDELEVARRSEDVIPTAVQHKISSELPDGWIVEDVPRKHGLKSDRYFLEPLIGMKFQSVPEVLCGASGSSKHGLYI